MKEIESGAIPDPTLVPSGPDEETAVADAGAGDPIQNTASPKDPEVDTSNMGDEGLI